MQVCMCDQIRVISISNSYPLSVQGTFKLFTSDYFEIYNGLLTKLDILSPLRPEAVTVGTIQRELSSARQSWAGPRVTPLLALSLS